MGVDEGSGGGQKLVGNANLELDQTRVTIRTVHIVEDKCSDTVVLGAPVVIACGDQILYWDSEKFKLRRG